MRYLIDGYNLAHALLLLTPGSPPGQVQRARLNLLERLARSASLFDMAVVFDAQGAPPRVPAHTAHGPIEIHNAKGGSADDLIEDLLASAGRGAYTVVSDDRRLQRSARQARCQALGCLDFVELLGRAPTPAPPPPADPEERPSSAQSDREKEEWARVFGELDGTDWDL